MAKRSATELFEQYYNALVLSLPMKDADFVEELLEHDLLSGDLKIRQESLTILNERSSYFLDNVIKPELADGNNRRFVSLLIVMKSNKHENVKDLAKKIEEELDIDLKCKNAFTFMFFYKPGTWLSWLLKVGFVHMCVCVCMCVCACVRACVHVSLLALITVHVK